MPERLSKKRRSEIMAKVRSRGNATTELRLMRLLRRHKITGWRRHAPIFGRPDFLFQKTRVALFVDGCFWHGCPRCYSAPQSSRAFWRNKIQSNRRRDLIVNRRLKREGWKVIRIWECRLDRPSAFLQKIKSRLTKI
jgi:DNA mismatch endonuclease, patch repair protein